MASKSKLEFLFFPEYIIMATRNFIFHKRLINFKLYLSTLKNLSSFRLSEFTLKVFAVTSKGFKKLEKRLNSKGRFSDPRGLLSALVQFTCIFFSLHLGSFVRKRVATDSEKLSFGSKMFNKANFLVFKSGIRIAFWDLAVLRHDYPYYNI